ncbi:hypothetical protein HDV06_005876 [Boothiomyces sp. JEL0866]|nr:hypothetical protein HDV06_005876 [Boothiomyces sp. JEL0866]
MSNGEFSFFTQDGCKGEKSTVQLNSKKNITIRGIGNVMTEFIKIDRGVESYRWTAFIPSAYLVYQYHVPMEIIAAICYVSAWILSLAVLCYFVYRYSATKSRYILILVISQTLWIIWEVMDFAYYNIVFPDSSVYYAQIYGEIEACIFNLATLTTVLNTCNLILSFNQVTSKWKIYGLYLAVVLTHVGLSVGKYDTYDASIQGAGNIYASWVQIAPLWILLMIIANTVPAFMITIRLLKNSEYQKDLSTLAATGKILTNNSKFTVLVSLQVLNSISYIICTCMQNYTEILASDRNFLGLNGIIALLFSMHSGINCLFIEHIRVFLKLKTKFSSYKNLQQSIVVVTNVSTENSTEDIPFRTRKRLSTIEEVSIFEEGAVEGLPHLF